jgi:hypothetical protein
MATYHHYSIILDSILRGLASIAIALVCCCTTALCDERHEHDHDEHSHEKTRRQHSAHEHGAAEFNFVLEDKTIHLEMILPAVDVVGFEHKPKSPEEKRRESEAIEVLKSPEKILSLTKSAKCSATSSDVTATSSHTHSRENSEHSEYRVVYQFHCSVPLALSEIDLLLFKYFPSIAKIRTNAVVNGKQQHLTLSDSQTSVAVTR